MENETDKFNHRERKIIIKNIVLLQVHHDY